MRPTEPRVLGPVDLTFKVKMNSKNLTFEEALARIESKCRRRWVFIGLIFASWIIGLLFLKHARGIVDSINIDASFEGAMSQIGYGMLFAGLGFCFLFLVPNIWFGRLPTREELAIMKNRNLTKSW